LRERNLLSLGGHVADDLREVRLRAFQVIDGVNVWLKLIAYEKEMSVNKKGGKGGKGGGGGTSDILLQLNLKEVVLLFIR